MYHIEINGWEANLKFSASHFIPGHEKCARLHGHNFALHFKAVGKPDHRGMVMDFIVLKKALRKLLAPVDHRMIVPSKSDDFTVEVDEDAGQIDVSLKNGKRYSFPADDVVVLDIKNTSAEALGEYFLNRLIESGIITDNVEEVELGVDENRGQGARIKKKLR
jgi:6-pyruvoyltetrahydropterin/6-carboxytetrahydropterin synthase